MNTKSRVSYEVTIVHDEHFMSLSSRIFYVLNFSSSPDPIPIRILEKSARSTLRPGYDDSPMKSLPSTYQSYHFHWLHPV